MFVFVLKQEMLNLNIGNKSLFNERKTHMYNLNKVFLIGNLTRDVELSTMPSGTPVADIGIASNRRWVDSEGSVKEDTCYVDCRAFGKNASSIKKNFSKGRPIFIEGRLNYDSWEDKITKKKQSRIRVIVEQWGFMDKKPGSTTVGVQSDEAAMAETVSSDDYEGIA
jgi:single-strand DNA-binding protein